MPDQIKEPEIPFIDPVKLAEFMKVTKHKYKFLEKIDGLEDQLTASIQQRSRDKAQHLRELELVMAANSKAIAITSPVLSSVVADFIREKAARDRWTEKTEKDYQSVFALFVRIVGDKAVADVERSDILYFLETLKKLPPNMNKLKQFKHKSIQEIIALNPAPLGIRTINKQTERVSSLFKWAMADVKYKVVRNPAANMNLDESGLQKREPFSNSELIKLFTSGMFLSLAFKHPSHYWLMPLALFTGARLGELSQLTCADFSQINDIHCVSINDEEAEASKNVKNINARRIFPIHDKLILLGLLDYVETCRKTGQSRLFPELIGKEKTESSAIASKWFARYRKECGILEKQTKVFHSFRHTVIGSLLDKQVLEQEIAQIVGHEAGLITSRVYYNRPDPTMRKPTIDQIELHEDVWQLIPKFEVVAIGLKRGIRSRIKK